MWKILTIVLAIAVTPALAQLSPDTKTKSPEITLRAWFQGYEFVPTAAQYKALGAKGLADGLIKIATDQLTHPLVQARAVSAMIHAADQPEIERALISMADDVTLSSLLRRKAIRALGDAYGMRHSARIAAVFSTAGEDVALQEACAKALLDIGPEAKTLRATLFQTASAPTVRALLRDQKRIGVIR